MADELVLTWQNLSVYATVQTKSLLRANKSQRIKLLHNVSGIVKSGSLTAIMGPSGAGKTTLLAAIGQRNTGNIFGEICLNGRPLDKDLMLKIAGFVPQHDLAINSLTVREHMKFMANLKMDRRVSKMQKTRIIKSLIQDLGLASCASNRLSELSGGERKRVALAVQMVTDPPFLLCDEPTTGLDSYTAASVVALLRDLAHRGKAVLCTIHQPASGIVELFDCLTLLVPGGRLAFHGPTEQAVQHLAQLGMVCPPAFNIAEFLVTRLNTSSDLLSDSFTSSHDFIHLNKEIEAVKSSALNNQLVFGMDETFLKFYSVQQPTSQCQLKWLLWRSTLDQLRDYKKLLLRLLMYLLTGCLISSPFAGTQLDQEGIQNFQGLNYTVITETVFTHSYAVMHTFPAEIPVLLRDIGNKVYRPAPYYLSKVLIMLPKVIMEILLFCCVIHLIVGIQGGAKGFLLFTIPVVMSGVASAAFGCCISAMFESITTASLLAVPLDFISYTFSGLFLQLATVPAYLAWCKYISRFYYGLEALSILQWSAVDHIPCSDNPNLPCISNGQGVLDQYGYNPKNLAFDLTSLTVMFVILHFIGYLMLRRRSKKQSVY